MTDIAFEKIMLRDMRALIKKGSLKKLKNYFIESDLTNNDIYSNIQHNINEAFSNACYYGKLPIVQYLLHSPELKMHADLHYKDDSVIFAAIDGKRSHILNYLQYSAELKEHLSLYKYIDEYFSELMKEYVQLNENSLYADADAYYINPEVTDIIEFLIYDYHISPTPHIIQLLKDQTKADYYEPAIKQLNSNLVYNNLLEKTKNIAITIDKPKKKKI